MQLSKFNNGILTLAVGKKYNLQARFLALSCVLNCPMLPRAIITDDPEYFSELYDVIIKYSVNMGNPFEVKLKLHHFTPFYETLFLDSDTLVYSDVRFMWDYFGNNSIVYNGRRIADGTWYADVSETIKYYNVPWMGKLNSGIFLFRKDSVGIEILDYAASLYDSHNKGLAGIKFPYFLGKMYPDEPFLAVAFGKYDQHPITNDGGKLGRSLIGARKIKLNVTRGISKFFKRGDDCEWVYPAIVHFVGDRNEFYLVEKLRLLFSCNTLIDLSLPIVWLPLKLLNSVKRGMRFLSRAKVSITEKQSRRHGGTQ